MSTESHTIDPNGREHETPAPEAAALQAAPSRTGMWLLLLLLGVTFLGWYFYGKRPPTAAPAPLTPVVALPPVERNPADASDAPSAATVAANKAAAAKAARAKAAAAAKPRATIAHPIASRSPEPRYPLTALRRGEGGTVVLRVNVGADGVPDDIAVARRSGSRDLDRAAMVAVRDWRFKPATRNGREVASVVEQPVEFRPLQ